MLNKSIKFGDGWVKGGVAWARQSDVYSVVLILCD